MRKLPLDPEMEKLLKDGLRKDFPEITETEIKEILMVSDDNFDAEGKVHPVRLR